MRNPGGFTRVLELSPESSESSEKKEMPACGVPIAKTDPSLVNSIATLVGTSSYR